MPEDIDIESNERMDNEKPIPRNKETIAALALLCIIWMLPFITLSQTGGLGGAIFISLGLILSVVGVLILFLPLRWLIRLSLDGKNKTLPRIVILIVFVALIAYIAPNLTPDYIKEMRYAANKYYNENPQEFDNSSEGEIIRIEIFNGPYNTYFLYTQEDPPSQHKGGIVIDYKNGWYFVGNFYPN